MKVRFMKRRRPSVERLADVDRRAARFKRNDENIT
jgi:hypothetical protein